MRAEQPANEHRHDRRRRRAALRQADDDTLLRRARAGSSDAFGELYRRHHADALRYAGRLSRYLDPGAADDILSEAIRKVLGAISAGAGPTTNFRQYLFTAVRSTALNRARQRHRAAPADAPTAIDDRTQDVVDHIVAKAVLHSLPERWRQILWATAVEQRTPTDLAPTLGMQPNSVAVLAHRARHAYRHAFLSSAEIEPPSGHAQAS
jgi:RNA polymerase sigma factor (sigma-70 family)